MWSWVKKGVPLRVEIGPRDIAANRIPVMRRDRGHKESTHQSREELLETVLSQLDEIQTSLYQKALEFRNAHIQKIDTKSDFYDFFTAKNAERPEIHGGFALSHWSEDPAVEEQIQKISASRSAASLSMDPKKKGYVLSVGKKCASA